MGLLPPDKIKPFSKEFAEVFQTMITEINRLSEVYQDIERMRKQVFEPLRTGGDNICIFMVTEQGGIGDCVGGTKASQGSGPWWYPGLIYEYDASSIQEDKEDPPVHIGEPEFGIGWDFVGSYCPPVEYPDGAQIKFNCLCEGVRLLAKRLDETTCIFSSALPRLGVVCSE